MLPGATIPSVTPNGAPTHLPTPAQRAIAFANRGLLKLDAADHHGALGDLDQAILLDPSHALAYLYRAECHKAMGFPEEAIEDYRVTIPMLTSALEEAEQEKKAMAMKVAAGEKSTSGNSNNRYVALYGQAMFGQLVALACGSCAKLCQCVSHLRMFILFLHSSPLFTHAFPASLAPLHVRSSAPNGVVSNPRCSHHTVASLSRNNATGTSPMKRSSPHST